MTLSRYLVFMGMDNVSAGQGGGFHDFRFSANHLDEIIPAAIKYKREKIHYNRFNKSGDYVQERFNWVHAVDTQDNYKIVLEMVGFESHYTENKDALIIRNAVIKI